MRMTNQVINYITSILFDFVRHRINASEYHIILFFLILYKEGYFETIDENSGDVKWEFFNQIDKSGNENLVFKMYYENNSGVFQKLNSEDYAELLKIFQILKRENIKNYFVAVFDKVLFEIAENQMGPLSFGIQPNSLSTLVNSLVSLPKNAKVYNPFAGLASFGINLPADSYYIGQDINPLIWSIGQFRLMAYEKTENMDFNLENSVTNWAAGKFDLIVSNPPVLNWREKERSEMGIDTRCVETFLIQKGLASLKPEGSLILIFSNRILYQGGELQKIRENLVNNDLLDTLIALPSGLLFNTGIPLTLMILKKNKSSKNKIRLIDARDFVLNPEGKQKIFDNERLERILQSRSDNSDELNVSIVQESSEEYYSLNKDENTKKLESDIEKYIDSVVVRNEDFDLNISRYFMEPIEDKEELIPLKKILVQLKERPQSLTSEDKLVRIQDLKDDNVDVFLNTSEVGNPRRNKERGMKIEESCLLVTRMGTSLKPTFFEYEGEPVFLNINIMAFRLNEDIRQIDPAYLINELSADYVKKQLMAYQIGTILTHWKISDFLSIKVDVPKNIEEQKAKVKGLRQISAQIELLQKEKDQIAYGEAKESFSNFASLKHTLGTPRTNILSWSKSLIKFFEKIEIEEWDKKFKELTGGQNGILDALKEIRADIDFMTQVLEKGEAGFQVRDYELSIVSLKRIKGVINAISDENLDFSLKKIIVEDNLKRRGIQVNEVLLKTLIDNILTNCQKHAFPNPRDENEVIIELRDVDDYLFLEIRNNGILFPKGMDKEKFVQQFTTSDSQKGGGIGGYDIHRIASYLGNKDWQLILDEEDIYPVKFQFKFHIQIMDEV